MKRTEIAKIELGHIIKIKKGDTISYCLSLGNNGEKVTCLPECLIEEGQNEDSYITVEINGIRKTFDMQKPSSISGKYIISCVDTLSEKDKNTLQKRVNTNKAEKLTVGDVIRFQEQTFLIKECREDCYRCWVYDLETAKTGVGLTIYKKDEIKKIASNATFEKKEEERAITEIGTIVSKKGTRRLYYIYGEEKGYYKAVRIDFLPESTLLINHVAYHTSLKEHIKIKKITENFLPLEKASTEEIRKNNVFFQETLKGGKIIKKSNQKKTYIVLLKTDDSLLCIDFEKYLEGEIYFEDCIKERMKIVGSVKREVYREILESLTDCYSSFLHKNQIKFILAKEFGV